MAKPATVKIKLVSSADTGFFYVTKKNPRTQTEKLSFKKYDPVARKHVDFKEAKIKKGRAAKRSERFAKANPSSAKRRRTARPTTGKAEWIDVTDLLRDGPDA